jgi:hypothetical protein
MDDSGSCWDGNGDHTYRLYMREGERMTARLDTGTACQGGSWSGTLKIFETGGCDNTTCAAKVYCEDYEYDQTANYTARQDGWVVIVADGTHASDDDGRYDLTITLTCRDGNCSCL